MTATAPAQPRFVRRTRLGPGEYRKDFRQIDSDAISAVTSAEADRVTPLMGKIYLRLVNAPSRYWEREGVLRFESEVGEEGHVTAWEALCEVAGVASATARKALRWMHEEGIVGYFAGKNGVGIRVFLNRATSSIGTRERGEKILEFPRASSQASRTSWGEVAFSDSFADPEVLDTDLNPRAPKDGAETKPVVKKVLDLMPPLDPRTRTPGRREGREVDAPQQARAVSVEEVVARLKGELEPCVRAAAAQAAAQTVIREAARTREWFETKALPKAVRVAQHETYDLLRKHGTLGERERRARAELGVGRAAAEAYAPPVARRLTPEGIRETAETCVALLEAQGKSIDVTLSEISSEGGGWLLPEDAPRVREAALALLGEGSERGS